MAFPEFANPALLRALGEVSLRDAPLKRRDVYQELLKSRLLVLIPGSDPLAGSSGVALKDTEVELFSLRSEDDRIGLPVFTDNDALARWSAPDGLNGLLLDGATICEMALKSGVDAVVINPDGPAGGEVERPELEALARGQIPEAGLLPDTKVEAGARISIGPLPGRPPAAFLDRLRQVAPAHPEVTGCYLYMMGVEDEAPQLTIGVVLAEELDREGFHALMGALIEELGDALNGAGDVRGAVVTADELPQVEESGLKVFQRLGGCDRAA